MIHKKNKSKHTLRSFFFTKVVWHNFCWFFFERREYATISLFSKQFPLLAFGNWTAEVV